MRRLLLNLVLASLAFCIFPGRTSATLIDWSTLSWTAGSLSNSYDVDPGSAGNDVTFTVSGNTAQLKPALGGGPQTPAITSNITGGFIPVHPSLQFAIDLTSSAQSVTITIDFSLVYAIGVANVSFNLFDVDFANGGGNTFQDVIRNISATSTTGTSIAPTISAGPSVTLSGTGLNQVITGTVGTADDSANANATISFNTTNIRSVTFTYGGSSLFSNPTYQHIALDNISYSVVPEMNPAWLSFIICGSLVVGSMIHRRSKHHRGPK